MRQNILINVLRERKYLHIDSVHQKLVAVLRQPLEVFPIHREAGELLPLVRYDQEVSSLLTAWTPSTTEIQHEPDTDWSTCIAGEGVYLKCVLCHSLPLLELPARDVGFRLRLAPSWHLHHFSTAVNGGVPQLRCRSPLSGATIVPPLHRAHDSWG